MASEIKRYAKYFTDFHAAEQNESGEEFEATDFLQTTSAIAEERVLALDYTFQYTGRFLAPTTEPRPQSG